VTREAKFCKELASADRSVSGSLVSPLQVECASVDDLVGEELVDGGLVSTLQVEGASVDDWVGEELVE
jgi:hypothetical protein